MSPHINEFVSLCMKQRGDKYVFGSEARFSDPDPDTFDCSELVEWAAARLGVKFIDGSFNQRNFCKNAGMLISVSTAIKTPGALLFRTPGKPGHVAVSRGDGSTIEARGRAYGVNVFSANGRTWTDGGLIPGFGYGIPLPPPAPKPPHQTGKAPVWTHEGNIVANHYDCEQAARWQAQMRNRGWGIIVDGDFGPASRTVCMKFQANKGLKIDGIVGPITWKATWELPIT